MNGQNRLGGCAWYCCGRREAMPGIEPRIRIRASARAAGGKLAHCTAGVGSAMPRIVAHHSAPLDGAGQASGYRPSASIPYDRAVTDHDRTIPLRYRSEEHASELQSLMRISYAVFCLQKKHQNSEQTHTTTQHT